MPLRYEFAEFTLLPEQRQLQKNGAVVALGSRAFDLLVCLIELREQVAGKDELLARVWPRMVVTENNLNAQVMALRKVCGPMAVMTVSGSGFRFGLSVTVLGATAAGGMDRRQRQSRRNQPKADVQEDPMSDQQLPDKPSIAVLPFTTVGSGHPDDFADGISEEITTELSRFHSLFVINRNSAFSFKGQAADVRVVARKLGVRYVLNGSVRHAGPRIRVTAQLIDGLTGNHLWVDKYDHHLADTLEATEELATAIVSAVAPQIADSEVVNARVSGQTDTNAHSLAQRSSRLQRGIAMSGDRAAFEDALRLAREAVALDPKSAFTWRTLGGALWLLVYFNFAPSVPEALAEGMDASSRATVLDANDHFAHTIKGLLSMLAGQSAAGLPSLRRARELNPNDAYTLAWLAFYEAIAGDPTRAEGYGLAALRRSPCDPMRHGFLLLMSGVYFSTSDYAKGAQFARAALQEAPHAAGAQVALAINSVGAGDIEAAQAACNAARKMAPGLVQARLAGIWPAPGTGYHQRAHRFFQIAAGSQETAAAAN